MFYVNLLYELHNIFIGVLLLNILGSLKNIPITQNSNNGTDGPDVRTKRSERLSFAQYFLPVVLLAVRSSVSCAARSSGTRNESRLSRRPRCADGTATSAGGGTSFTRTPTRLPLYETSTLCGLRRRCSAPLWSMYCRPVRSQALDANQI